MGNKNKIEYLIQRGQYCTDWLWVCIIYELFTMVGTSSVNRMKPSNNDQINYVFYCHKILNIHICFLMLFYLFGCHCWNKLFLASILSNCYYYFNSAELMRCIIWNFIEFISSSVLAHFISIFPLENCRISSTRICCFWELSI